MYYNMNFNNRFVLLLSASHLLSKTLHAKIHVNNIQNHIWRLLIIQKGSNSPLPLFDISYMYSVITVIWSVIYEQQLDREIATSPGFPVELMQKHPSNVNTWKEIGNDHSNNASESHKLITLTVLLLLLLMSAFITVR